MVVEKVDITHPSLNTELLMLISLFWPIIYQYWCIVPFFLCEFLNLKCILRPNMMNNINICCNTLKKKTDFVPAVCANPWKSHIGQQVCGKRYFDGWQLQRLRAWGNSSSFKKNRSYAHKEIILYVVILYPNKETQKWLILHTIYSIEELDGGGDKAHNSYQFNHCTRHSHQAKFLHRIEIWQINDAVHPSCWR